MHVHLCLCRRKVMKRIKELLGAAPAPNFGSQTPTHLMHPLVRTSAKLWSTDTNTPDASAHLPATPGCAACLSFAMTPLGNSDAVIPTHHDGFASGLPTLSPPRTPHPAPPFPANVEAQNQAPPTDQIHPLPRFTPSTDSPPRQEILTGVGVVDAREHDRKSRIEELNIIEKLRGSQEASEKNAEQSTEPNVIFGWHAREQGAHTHAHIQAL